MGYAPVEGTDWMLTYLIRESVIGQRITPITNRVLYRSIAQALLTVLALVIMFLIVLRQNRKNAAELAEKEASEATRRIRAMDRPDAKEIPIIALTANAFDEDVQRSLQAGLNAHLPKPVQPDSLYETLESLIKA